MSEFTDITSCISEEIKQFRASFEQVLHSKVPLADSVIKYFLDRKGKQLRPLMAILAAKIINGQVTEATINGAVALELVHNASLMHDDVVDDSPERRGIATINKVWDNRVAVLMGDYYFAKCLTCINATGSMQISNILADMVIRLSEGELEQQSNARSHFMSEESYFSIISGKTASLFSACLRIGACSVNANKEDFDKMARIGELMGLIFQIRDDIFDYYPTNEGVGKPTGHDILEGKVTLPLLYALQHSSSEENAQIKQLLEDNTTLSESQVQYLVSFAKDAGGIDYAQAKMKNLAFEAKKILFSFKESAARDSLAKLIDFFIEREK